MKIPVSPPNWQRVLKEAISGALGGYLDKIEISPVTDKGKYLHWDKLRHLDPPAGVSIMNWWCRLKMARHALYHYLPFADNCGQPFRLAIPDILFKKLTFIDRNMGNIIQNPPHLLINQEAQDTYFIQSLIEEAITSSQLEGASTTRKVAKEMLRTQRKPTDISERMIFNNYQAMQFVREIKNEPLTINIILELHKILTKDTLDSETVGQLRKTDDIVVTDPRNGEILHHPPKAKELQQRLQALCEFANASEDRYQFFMHPVIKAILLHFMLAYDHPFVDGNGRTARALFYWSMAYQKYGLMEFISISNVVKNQFAKYMRAFLYTETDDNDTTYFIFHQINVISKAIGAFFDKVKKQNHEIEQIEQLLYMNPILKDRLNYRQISLLKHALKNPHGEYLIDAHRRSHNVTYDTARNDLLNLTALGLLIKQKRGKAFIFIIPKDLKKRIHTE